ncbi:MAG: dephospho-CoA kinase, partial [Armatimonadia bacterium]|nr:dephospho-CoA kinase [Armatimonadia bacterium]
MIDSAREPDPRRLPPSCTYPGVRTLGLTGPAAGGKSYLLGLLEVAGAEVIETDAVYRELIGPGSDLLARIEGAFPGVVAGDGSLDRAELGRRVFSDDAALERLNAIVHPPLGAAVARAVTDAAEAGARRIALEAAVLFEIGADRLCDEVWFVACEAGERIRRLREVRGWSEERARRLVEGQGAMEQVRARCDRVVD